MTTTLKIVDWVDNSNLRYVSWNQSYLERTATTYNLNNNQAVVFSNVAQTKVRLVARLNNLIVLILPPVDPQRRLGLYLEINQFLRGLPVKNQNISNLIANEIELATKRAERLLSRQLLAKTAKRTKRS